MPEGVARCGRGAIRTKPLVVVVRPLRGAQSARIHSHTVDRDQVDLLRAFDTRYPCLACGTRVGFSWSHAPGCSSMPLGRGRRFIVSKPGMSKVIPPSLPATLEMGLDAESPNCNKALRKTASHHLFTA